MQQLLLATCTSSLPTGSEPAFARCARSAAELRSRQTALSPNRAPFVLSSLTYSLWKGIRALRSRCCRITLSPKRAFAEQRSRQTWLSPNRAPFVLSGLTYWALKSKTIHLFSWISAENKETTWKSTMSKTAVWGPH